MCLFRFFYTSFLSIVCKSIPNIPEYRPLLTAWIDRQGDYLLSLHLPAPARPPPGSPKGTSSQQSPIKEPLHSPSLSCHQATTTVIFNTKVKVSLHRETKDERNVAITSFLNP